MAYQFAPPARWQGDDQSAFLSRGTGASSSLSSIKTSPESSETAYKHVKSVAKDDGKGADLLDLISNGIGGFKDHSTSVMIPADAYLAMEISLHFHCNNAIRNTDVSFY